MRCPARRTAEEGRLSVAKRPPGEHNARGIPSSTGDTTMGLWDKLRGELIDIIEWTQPSDSEVLAYRFPRYDNEIKYGAQLIVREGQAAAFVNEGQLADVYGPGTFTLETQNMP